MGIGGANLLASGPLGWDAGERGSGVDTIIFAVIAAMFWVMIRRPERSVVLVTFGISLVLVLFLFQHHVTSALELEF